MNPNTLILVVDDDDSHRRLVQRWLERTGYAVQGLSSGEACISTLSSERPAVVLLDLKMGDVGGLDVLRYIREHHPAVPVVMLTATADVPVVVEAMQIGASDYLTKPVSRRQLEDAVLGALDSSPMIRPSDDASDAVEASEGYGGIIGSSPRMARLYRELDRVAPSDVTVLITGESGTGKELVARAIHEQSARQASPFIALNCAAIPASLQESELFGHEKGAFTGADARRPGRFEIANGGTLFLDEVGELPADLQAKLLRVLQERRFFRVGGREEISVDVRVIAATHRDLARKVQQQTFREDLFYRLAVFELEVPPLRDRGADILEIADFYLGRLGSRHGRQVKRFSYEAIRVMESYTWPGNVRELQNAVERAVVVAEGDTIEVQDLPSRLRHGAPVTFDIPQPSPAVDSGRVMFDEAEELSGGYRPIEKMEKEAIEAALRAASGNVSEVIRTLGIPRTTLYRKLKKYGLR